jgi:hypothetical protein
MSRLCLSLHSTYEYTAFEQPHNVRIPVSRKAPVLLSAVLQRVNNRALIGTLGLVTLAILKVKGSFGCHR